MQQTLESRLREAMRRAADDLDAAAAQAEIARPVAALTDEERTRVDSLVASCRTRSDSLRRGAGRVGRKPPATPPQQNADGSPASWFDRRVADLVRLAEQLPGFRLQKAEAIAALNHAGDLLGGRDLRWRLLPVETEDEPTGDASPATEDGAIRERREALAVLLQPIQAATGQSWSRERWGAWVQALRDLPQDAIRAAVDQWVRTSTNPHPMPADIRRLVEDQQALARRF